MPFENKTKADAASPFWGPALDLASTHALLSCCPGRSAWVFVLSSEASFLPFGIFTNFIFHHVSPRISSWKWNTLFKHLGNQRTPRSITTGTSLSQLNQTFPEFVSSGGPMSPFLETRKRIKVRGCLQEVFFSFLKTNLEESKLKTFLQNICLNGAHFKMLSFNGYSQFLVFCVFLSRLPSTCILTFKIIWIPLLSSVKFFTIFIK